MTSDADPAASKRTRFELWPGTRNCPDEVLLEDLRRVARASAGDSVTKDAYARQGRFHPKTLVNHFGSWNRALLRAGLTVRKRVGIPLDELTADLIRVARQLGVRQLGQHEYDAHGAFRHDTIVSRFGSWSRAMAAIGLQPVGRSEMITLEELFGNLATVWGTLGCIPTRDDMRPPISRFSHRPYVQRFGTWRAALQAFVAAANAEAP